MIIRFTGIHNVSKHTLVVSQQIGDTKPEILLARLITNNGKSLGTSEVPISDYYNTKSDSSKPPPNFETNTLLRVEPKGYVRFLNFHLSKDKQFIRFHLEDNKVAQENKLQINTIIEGAYQYLEYKSTHGEVSRRMLLGEAKSDQVIDLYLTLSHTLGFLLEPMNKELEHLSRNAKSVSRLLYAYLLSKTNVVYLPVESTDGKTFQVFLYKAEEFQNPVTNKPRIELGVITSIEDKALYKQYEANGGKCLGDVIFSPQTCVSVTDPKTGRKVALNKIELTLTCNYTPEAAHQGLFATARIDYLIRLENDSDNTVISWKLEQPKESNHQINPKTGLLTLDTKALGTSIKLIAKIEVRFEIKLPEKFPILLQRDINDANWLGNLKGQRAIGSLYAIYKRLSDTQKEDLKELKLLRLLVSTDTTQYAMLTNTILVKEADLKDDSSVISYQWMRLLSEALLHAKLKKMGLTPETIYTNILIYNQIALPLIAEPYFSMPLFVTVLLPPNFLFSYLLDSFEQALSAIKDDVKTFSELTGWEMRNFNLKTIPLIGWFCNTFLRMPPNYIYATLSNNSFYGWHLDLKNKNIKDNKWKEAGMSTEVSALNPISDMIDSMATVALDEQVYNKLSPEKKLPNKSRQDLLQRHTWMLNGKN